MDGYTDVEDVGKLYIYYIILEFIYCRLLIPL